MDDVTEMFCRHFVLTEEERRPVVILEANLPRVQSSEVFLVGNVFSHKTFNKEVFKHTMRRLWKPKADVVIVDGDGDHKEVFGSYLLVRVVVDITKPIRKCMNIQLPGVKGGLINMDLRYEKLSCVCFWCGCFDHIKKQCARYLGGEVSDLYKPYGKWFQEGFIEPDYRRPVGRRLGLGDEPPLPPWKMTMLENMEIGYDREEGRKET